MWSIGCVAALSCANVRQCGGAGLPFPQAGMLQSELKLAPISGVIGKASWPTLGSMTMLPSPTTPSSSAQTRGRRAWYIQS
eukprot:CAMPEP_0174762572 /NCGR_PEP_ID=MMETSP1094-20130205/109843_1 /TAXON_ID=156173 /ORGANISM="Chrysochromulina brevifilum, Strain UTEX LB 985" /LENGTH=80 /DNA_ID=CAMNT_0015968525 /DNA_START=584 /DNA_END=826 /DNA_ORIENTATION=-